MAIVSAEVRFAPQLTAWFTANPTKVLQDGEIVYCSDGANIGKYVIGDNSTQLSALTFYGGLSSSGLTIGTTTITSGTNTRILYNNAGVVGEYLVTGTGTTAVLSTSPTFTTSIFSPLVVGGSAVGSTLSLQGTSGNGTTTGAAIIGLVGNAGATTSHTIYNDGQFIVGTNTRIGGALGVFQTNINSAKVTLGAWGASQAAIWMQQATPTTGNYILRSSGTEAILNAPSTSIQFNYAGTNRHNFYGIGVSFAPTNTTGLAWTTYSFTVPAHTNQTLSTNIPNFKVTGNTIQWATGALATQYFNYFSANTVAFVGASTATHVANFRSDAPLQGTNATATNLYAIDCGGHMFIANSVGVPSNNPTGGGILYVESGALKYRSSNGTVTTVGPL